MKVSIIGSNTITDKNLVLKEVENYLYSSKYLYNNLTILGTGGKGVASIIKDWSVEKEIDFVEFLPYHLVDNKVDFSSKYFFIRTKQIIDNSDEAILFWNGDCKEIEYAIKYSQKKNVPIKVIKVPERS